jgi:DNA mismatch repair ATPase MutL
MQRIGYTLKEAVADLVNNSIDASAHKVLVRFFRGTQAITQVAIVDDGSGMDEETLRHAMQYGVQTHRRD